MRTDLLARIAAVSFRRDRERIIVRRTVGATMPLCDHGSPSSFGRDTGLQARMLLTIFLLGARLRGADRRAVRRGAERDHDPHHRRRPVRAAVLRLGQARAARHGRPGGLAAGGARAARDDRAPLHPGRPAQAEDRRRRHVDAQRLRDGALARRPATVCATTGIMDLLSPAELEGVMAHELTHIANRDVMVMTLAASSPRSPR